MAALEPLEGLAKDGTLTVQDNLLQLLDSSAYREAMLAFATSPEHSLISVEARAFLYQAIRMLRPDHVLEIGTYKAGTAEVMARALEANGHGRLVTLDPYGAETATRGIAAWPEPLRQRTFLHLCSSMEYWRLVEETGKGPAQGFVSTFGLALVDGNHNYDFVTYDLGMLSRHMAPGGVIVCDNIDQAGVFWAIKHFLTTRPGWTVLGDPLAAHRKDDPFGTMRPSFSCQIILVAPEHTQVSETPRAMLTGYFPQIGIQGLEFDLTPDHGPGTLHLLVFFRSFDHSPRRVSPNEWRWVKQLPLAAGQTQAVLELPRVETDMDPAQSSRLAEVVLVWEPTGAGVLELAATPRVVTTDGSRVPFR